MIHIVEVEGRSEQGVLRPFICRAENGERYFVKGRGAGRAGLIAEYVAGTLGKAFGLPIPPFEVAQVPVSLIEGSAVEGIRELGSGPVFASRRIPFVQEFGASTYRRVPPELRQRILLFDWFAREKEYQETLMANHLRQVFGRAELMRLYRIDQVGNDQYSVSLPFVYREGERVIKAVKPLDLDKENSTKVYEHGDQWVTRVRRLREMGEQPDDLLFTVRTPREGRRRMEAGREIVRELERLETKVVAFSDEDAVLQFARVSSPAAASN